MTVIAIIAVLAALLLSALAGAKRQAEWIQCLNNLRQIGLAEMMYRAENNGYFVPNNADVRGPVATSKGYQSWGNGVMDFTSSSDNVDTGLFMNPNHWKSPGRSGLLGPYLKNPAVFKCPSDKSMARIFGHNRNRVRSMAMNGLVGGGVFRSDGYSWVAGSNSNLRRVAKESEVTGGRSPARLFTFLDVREDSIWSTFFSTPLSVNGQPAANNFDLPSSYHGGAGNLVFGDGRIERHKWVDPRTNPALVKGKWLPPEHFNNSSGVGVNNPDFEWFTRAAFGWPH